MRVLPENKYGYFTEAAFEDLSEVEDKFIEVSQHELKQLGVTLRFSDSLDSIIEMTEQDFAEISKQVELSKKEERIVQLKTYLDTEWRWRNERYYAELEEIEMGLREATTETREELILARKNAVDEINRLEGELQCMNQNE